MSTYCYSCMEQIPDNSRFCPHCGASTVNKALVHQLQPGTVLCEKYIIGKVLGQGNFGITYLAKHLFLDVPVAIKEFYPNGVANRNTNQSNELSYINSRQNRFCQAQKERFLKEARILAKFNGEEGVVDVLDVFEANNTAYVVMEYLTGPTLKDYVAENGPMEEKALLQLLLPVIAEMGKVHAFGMLHRDICPEHFVIQSNGQVKLLDFASAKEIDNPNTVSFLLKQGFAAAEQYQSDGNLGPWTDVYAMCATLYFCLTGSPPIEAVERYADSERAALYFDERLAVSERCKRALALGMAVKAEDRLQNMDELEQALTSTYVPPQPAPPVNPAPPAAPAPPVNPAPPAVPAPQKTWSCPNCRAENSLSASVCASCGYSKKKKVSKGALILGLCSLGLLAAILLLLFLPPIGGGDQQIPAPAVRQDDTVSVDLSGQSLTDIQIAVANQLKEDLGLLIFDSVILTGDKVMPYASYLSCAKNAPIFSVGSRDKTVHVESYLLSNLSSDSRVYIIGGTSSVSEEIENELIELGCTTKRLAGDTRYTTNLEVLYETGIAEGAEILVCAGNDDAGDIPVAALGMPVLLVSSSLSEAQERFLQELVDCSFTVISIDGSVSEDVIDALGAYGTVRVFASDDPAELCCLVSEYYFSKPSAVALAQAEDPSVGYSLGLLARVWQAPLFLTENGGEPVLTDYLSGLDVRSHVSAGQSDWLSGSELQALLNPGVGEDTDEAAN